MELTIREAATLLGRSERAVRAQVARKALPAVKRGGRWMTPRHALPLTDAQRQAVREKADDVRAAVESAVRKHLSSAEDLEPFRDGRRVLLALAGGP
jgi:excisionase family DNA binding protein